LKTCRSSVEEACVQQVGQLARLRKAPRAVIGLLLRHARDMQLRLPEHTSCSLAFA
jgi:hypothetical protein